MEIWLSRGWTRGWRKGSKSDPCCDPAIAKGVVDGLLDRVTFVHSGLKVDWVSEWYQRRRVICRTGSEEACIEFLCQSVEQRAELDFPAFQLIGGHVRMRRME